MTSSFTISPNLGQAINLATRDLAANAEKAVVGEANLHGFSGPVFIGQRPLAWLELNGFINPVSETDTIKPGRKYIYDKQELRKLIAEFNTPKSIIITTESIHAAAIATGIIPPKKKELPKYDTSDILEAFKSSR